MLHTKSLLLGSLLLLAVLVRLPALTAGWPYLNYIDEGHLLHKSVRLLANGGWDPAYYVYPSLPIYAVTAAARLYSPVYSVVHGRKLSQDLSPLPIVYYDVVEPPELVLLGRLLSLALSLGTVALTGLLAGRLAGPRAGLAAAWLAALAPALVIRSAGVTVDPYATFFVMAALLAAEKIREGDRYVAIAGALTGLAAVSKYPAVLVCLPVALAILFSGGDWKVKLRRLGLAGTAAAAGAVLAMPALVLRTAKVLRALERQSAAYARVKMGSYWDQAIHRAEWDQPLEHPELGIAFLLLAAAGLVIALRDRKLVRPVGGWLLFAGVYGLLLSRYPFHAFRNLLPFVPLACILVSVLYAKLRESARRPLALDLGATVLPVLLFAPGLAQYVRHQAMLKDSREQAVRWLAENVKPEDAVLFSQEMAFLPGRVRGLDAEASVQPWRKMRAAIRKGRARFVVLGELTLPGGRPIPQRARQEIAERYHLRARFGEQRTWEHPRWFRGNRQVVYVLEWKS